jgi:phosphoglycolate phosphatase-like HAD superfamily hydrolase
MKNSDTPIRGVLFDLDDTLNDRKRSWMAFVRLLIDRNSLAACEAESAQAAIVAADRGGYRTKGNSPINAKPGFRHTDSGTR